MPTDSIWQKTLESKSHSSYSWSGTKLFVHSQAKTSSFEKLELKLDAELERNPDRGEVPQISIYFDGLQKAA